MKKVIFAAAVLGLGVYAGNAHAACSYNTGTAKGVKSTFVRAYAPCPGTEHPINTQTEGGTPACQPITPREIDGDGTTFLFGPGGKCSGQTQAKLVSDCAKYGAESGPCSVTFVKNKCSGIVHGDGTTPIDAEQTDGADAGWSLATLSRASFDDDTNGPMTVIDFPVTFLFSDPKAGKMQVKSNSIAALTPLVGANNADLPVCTSIELVDIVIKDPAGLPFARIGGATQPKE